MNIIRKVCFIVVLIIAGPSSFAQLGFGLKGGLNLSSVNIDDPEASYESRTGVHAGIFLRARFNKVAIQPEVLLSTQNGESDRPNLVNVEESFTYLSVPVMLKFYPLGGLNIQLGPQFGFLLDGEREYETVLGTVQRDITEAYKSSDIAVAVGAGYDFEFGLGLGFRYNVGVKDINNVGGGDEARSRNFMVSLSWNFLNGD